MEGLNWTFIGIVVTVVGGGAINLLIKIIPQRTARKDYQLKQIEGLESRLANSEERYDKLMARLDASEERMDQQELRIRGLEEEKFHMTRHIFRLEDQVVDAGMVPVARPQQIEETLNYRHVTHEMRGANQKEE